MKKYKKILVIIATIAIALILGTITSDASSSDLYLNNLEFIAQINSDGSMDVTEKWNIDISDTNTLYKTFKTDSSKYSDIKDVKVKEIKNNLQVDLYPANNWSYHMSNGYYYGGLNSDNLFEICWGVGLQDKRATRQYEISYTVEDAIAKYSDYAELYWQFVGSDFEISANKIKGTILLPYNANSKEEIKVWGHTEDLNGEIYATDYNKIEFNINNFRSGRYVEVRTLFPTNMIYYSARNRNKEILQEVINEETVWAEEANARRKQRENIKFIVGIIITIISISLDGLLIVLSYKKVKKIRNSKKIKPTQEIEYYREIPREKEITPSEAMYIYNKRVTSFTTTEIGRIFSSTLLDLNLKKLIEFSVEKSKTNKEIVTIKILKEYDEILNNYQDERIIFEFLKSACGENKQITIKELQKFIEKHATKIKSLKDNVEKTTKRKLVENEIINAEEKKAHEKITSSISLYCLMIIYILAFGIPGSIILGAIVGISCSILFVLTIINLITAIILQNRINVFTQKGVDEHEEWKALKKYMEDFSLLKEKEIPEIVLWEKFLVYATTFGIEKKVLKQLKILYPDIENSIDANTYTCMHLMMNTNFSNSFSNSISSSISSTYSSGSGSGGGFSSGGGRWPEVGGGGGGR